MVEYNSKKYYTFEEMKADANSKCPFDNTLMMELLNVKRIPYIQTPFGWVQITKDEYFRARKRGVELYG